MDCKLLSCFFILTFAAYINAEYNCQYKKDGFYTDLEFCHVYWRCNYGVPEEYECPAGTAWNHIELRCDWLDNVDCTRGGTITQKPEETEAPETEEPDTDEPDTETDEPETEEPETTTVKSTKKGDKTKQTTTEPNADEKNTADNMSSIESTGPKIVAMGLVGDPTPTEAVQNSFLQSIESEPLVGELHQQQQTNENMTLDSESLPLASEPLPIALSAGVSESVPLASESLEVFLAETQTPVNELLIQTTEPVPTTTTTKKVKTTRKISSMEERKNFEYDTLCNGLLASTGFVSDPFICNKYLRCNHGVAERFTCATGTLWNSKDKMCTWPALVDCDDREIFTDSELVREEQGISTSAEASDEEDEEEDEEEEESKEGSKETAAGASSSSSKELTASAAAISSSKEQTSSETSAEASTETESSSEKSNKNHKHRLSSTRSLLTRKKKNGANVRELDAKETTVATSLASTSSQVAVTVANSTSSICHSVGTYNLPDNTNCATYIACNNGKETHATCPERHLFNAETAQCEEFQLVFCGSRPVNHADKNQCASKRDGIYPDIERSCRIFYQCVSQQKVREATCPNNLKFNTMTGRCDNPANILPPCGTYNVTLGSGSNTSSSASIHRLISWSKYLIALLATKLTILRLF